jgi:hypothetical protein
MMDAMNLVVMSFVVSQAVLLSITSDELRAVLLSITDVPAPEQHDDNGPHLLSEEA